MTEHFAIQKTIPWAVIIGALVYLVGFVLYEARQTAAIEANAKSIQRESDVREKFFDKTRMDIKSIENSLVSQGLTLVRIEQSIKYISQSLRGNKNEI